MHASTVEASALAAMPFQEPSGASTAAFLAVVGFVCATFVAASYFAHPTGQRHPRTLTGPVAGLLVWLVASYLGAQTGFFSSLAGSFSLGALLLVFNGITLIVALGPLGFRFATHLPIGALIGFHTFRIPLEIVLHSWFRQGMLPIQMTYAGVNFDIAIGVLALGLAPLLPKLSATPQWRLVAAFSLLGVGFLLNVMSIAVRSTPWPMRTFFNDPPVLLMFHTPFVWIMPICVCGALFAHIVTFRWLYKQRQLLR